MSINIIYSETFYHKHESSSIKCKISLLETNISFLEFIYNKKDYTCLLSNFRKQINDMVIFYIKETNDDKNFGFIDNNLLNITFEQKKNFVLKLAKDFITCFFHLVDLYKNNLIDYCVYFCNNFSNNNINSYSISLQKLVCEFIVQKKILNKETTFILYNWQSA